MAYAACHTIQTKQITVHIYRVYAIIARPNGQNDLMLQPRIPRDNIFCPRQEEHTQAYTGVDTLVSAIIS